MITWGQVTLLVPGNAGPDPQGGVAGEPPSSCLCHQVPPTPLTGKFLVTEEVLPPAWTDGVNFGAARECWGCSLSVFFRNQS